MTRAEARKLLAKYGYYGRFSLRNGAVVQVLTLKEWPKRGDWKVIKAIFKPVVVIFEGKGITGKTFAGPIYREDLWGRILSYYN